MTLGVYIAGSSANAARALQWSAIIRENASLKLTSTWQDTKPEKWSGKDRDIPALDQRNVARRCLTEIEAAQIFWLLWTPGRMQGALVELGFAIAHHRCIIVSGYECDQTVFTACADVRHAVDSIAYTDVLSIAANRRTPRVSQVVAV